MESSRKFSPLLLLLVAALFLGACSHIAAEAPRTEFEDPLSNQTGEIHREDEAHSEDAVHRHLDPEDVDMAIQVVLVPSELTAGPNRFAIGIFDQGGDMVHEGSVHLHYYDLNDPANPFFEMEADAGISQTPDKLVTVFTHERNFESGEYGVEVELTMPDGSTGLSGIRFDVLPESLSIEVGEQVPDIGSPTLRTNYQDLSTLTSAEEPNPAFYELSLDEALKNGKPTLLLFATPAFCQTRFCGPSYEIFDALHQKYASDLNFIHIEVFTGLPDPEANGWEPAAPLIAFGLESEPWVYLISEDGTVLYRVEGVITMEEIERNLLANIDL